MAIGVKLKSAWAFKKGPSAQGHDEVRKQTSIPANNYPMWEAWWLSSDSVLLTKNLTDSLTITETVSLQSVVVRIITDGLTITDNLSVERNIIRQIEDSLSLSDTLISKEAFKSFSDSFIISEQLAKEINKTQEDYIVISEVFNKDQNKVFSDLVILTEDISKQVELNKSDSLSFIDSLSQFIDRILVIISRIFGRTLNMSSSIYKNLIIDSSITSNSVNIVNGIELDTMTIESTIKRNLTLNTTIE